jgi:predicted unusual protein kinase regulating ubiquinone biosynthesis (AarF/ABC1/UbiB family)
LKLKCDELAQSFAFNVNCAATKRPDIIGEEAADSLMALQDQMGPFSSEEAYQMIRDEIGYKVGTD